VRQLIRHTASPLEGHVFTAYDLQQRGRAAEAHTTLEQALQIRESRRALTLMAEVESTLSGADKAQWWFARAAAAPLEEQWVCATCHHTSSEWTLFCPQCRSCDTHTLTLASHAIASVEVVKKL
jgi:uncharacterized membrane-anchored protein